VVHADGRNWASWRSWAVVAATLGALVAGCSDDDGTGVLDLDELGPGTCLAVTDDLGEEVKTLPVIDCVEDHTHEIYANVDWTGADVFPGLEALDAFAEQECVGAFEPFVGISAFDSQLTFTWLTPTLGSWNDHDDRTVLCVLANPDAAPLIGSMQGTRV
jgi:hypothetical protein